MTDRIRLLTSMPVDAMNALSMAQIRQIQAESAKADMGNPITEPDRPLSEGEGEPCPES